MKRSTVTGRLSGLERLEASSAGNPRWKITLDRALVYETRVNASVSWEVDNHRVGRQVTLTLEAGAVVGMEYAR